MSTNREYLDQLASESPDKLKAWFDAEHVDSHSKSHSKTESNLTEQSKSLSDDADSREKLEADVRKILHGAYMLAWMHGNENRRGSSFEKLHVEFYNLLDRQAEITERQYEERVAAIEQQVDRLKRENMNLAHDLGECMEMNDRLSDERELHRSKLGECADLAEQIRNVAMGFGDAALVDLEGNVV